MKNNATAFALVTVALILGLWAALQAVRYHFLSRELNKAQMQVLQVQTRLNHARGLATEAIEYSQRNPAIDRILETFALKPRPATNPAPASNPRPAAKRRYEFT